MSHPSDFDETDKAMLEKLKEAIKEEVSLTLQIRVTKEQKALIELRAKNGGMTVEEYITRSLCR